MLKIAMFNHINIKIDSWSTSVETYSIFHMKLFVMQHPQRIALRYAKS